MSDQFGRGDWLELPSGRRPVVIRQARLAPLRLRASRPHSNRDFVVTDQPSHGENADPQGQREAGGDFGIGGHDRCAVKLGGVVVDAIAKDHRVHTDQHQ